MTALEKFIRFLDRQFGPPRLFLVVAAWALALGAWGDDVRFTEGGPVSGLLVNDSREAVDRSSNDPVVGAATVLTEYIRTRHSVHRAQRRPR